MSNVRATRPFLHKTYCDWLTLQTLSTPNRHIVLDGQSLDIASVIAVAFHGIFAEATRDSRTLQAIEDSVALVDRHLHRTQTVYGVNTGVGASADTRTEHSHLLQKSLIQHQNAGVLTTVDKEFAQGTDMTYSLKDPERLAMLMHMVRAMMLIRCNSLLRGHSGVRIGVVDSILSLIAHNLTPVVPLRGSISASGDLMPLSYVAGVLEGNADCFVDSGSSKDGLRSSNRMTTADRALALAGLQAFSFGPKEALGLLNGTAASCAAASIAIYQVRHQAVLAQITTAMATEALLGSMHNHDPFISHIRPHSGQTEAAAAILGFLAGSHLVPDRDPRKTGLFQDRYPLRTASQWIGPQLEDLTLAIQQIEIELNSTTDNPLIDVEHDTIHHGGNFQAASVTSAMEKTLNAVQMLGRLTFAQCSELLNSALNKDLPPNLCADDPSLSFTFKGVDVSMAAYMSELAHLAHPVSPYVQSAEMHNQAVNSLALLAARRASDASKLLALMNANYLYALCQALDLRCLHLAFVAAVEPKVLALIESIFGPMLSQAANGVNDLQKDLWPVILKQWLAAVSLDLAERGKATAEKVLGPLITTLRLHLDATSTSDPHIFTMLCDFQTWLADILVSVYATTRKAFFEQPMTSAFLGLASRIMYDFIRKELQVPMHRGLVDHPTAPLESTASMRDRLTIGSWISKIYEAIQSNAIHAPMMNIVEVLENENQG